MLLAIKAVQDVLATVGIYPQKMTTVAKDGKSSTVERTTYQNGWNAAIIYISKKICEQFDIMSEGVDEDLALLALADVGWIKGDIFQLNMNDTFYYGADMESINREEVKEVARLFRTYGSKGIDYWVAQKRGYDPKVAKYERGVEEVRKNESLRLKDKEEKKDG
jgi:hypothetical protein